MRPRSDAPAQEPRHPPDLRLVPAALAVWATVVLGLGAGTPAASASAVAAAALTTVALWRHWSPVLLAAAGCAAAAGIVVTAHTMLVAQHPLRGPAEQAASAVLEVVVRDDPRAVRSGAQPGGPPQLVVLATVVAASVGEERWSSGGRVVLLAPAVGWSALLPGQSVVAEGLLTPALRSDLTVAVLRVRGPPRSVAAPPWWQDAAGGLRTGLRDVASQVLPPSSAGLLPGLAVGDTSGVTAKVDSDFRAAGLTHLMAVSGANPDW